MQAINNDAFVDEQESFLQREESSIEDDLRKIENEEIRKDEEIDKKVMEVLEEKCSSENFIKASINTDMDEHKLSKVLNDDDVLQDLWQAKMEVDKSSNSINSAFDNTSSNYRIELSPNSTYLKESLSKPLIQALSEIVAKKPADPIEYLGFWLLHYKTCEQRVIVPRYTKKSESEISSDREISKLKIEDTEDFPIKRSDEMQYSEDEDYN